MKEKTSPYNLFQERYYHDPWKLLCSTICLNLCRGSTFERIHEVLFDRWKTPAEMAEADFHELSFMLKSLGLHNRRATRLITMSRSYLTWDGVDPLDLPGIGTYGSDSYLIFVKDRFDVVPKDKELLNWMRWKGFLS